MVVNGRRAEARAEDIGPEHADTRTSPDAPSPRPVVTDPRAVLALQRLAGNAAVSQLLVRAPRQAGPIVVQRGKPKRLKERTKELQGKITKATKLCGRGKLGEAAYDALVELAGELDDANADEVAALERKYHVIISNHSVGLNLAPSHPAGAHIVDPTGNLRAAYSNVRASFYPNNYWATALTAKQNWMTNHPGITPGTVRCPGSAGIAHDVQPTDMTIEHDVPVCQHWNVGHPPHSAGHDSDAATRWAFYNDTTNHSYLCRSCNSSLGSGGVYYRQSVGPNFRA